MDREALLIEVMPYAQKASRNAYFRYGVDQDDTFQMVMLELWQHILKGFKAHNPIGYLRS